MRYSDGNRELKAKKLLKAKTFRLAAQLPLFDKNERRALAKACLVNGADTDEKQITALAQAKIL